jgi:LysM repeat protein
MAEEDYDDEPSMRLSSAFIVVLLLHVVAIGGIYAFDAVKKRHPAPPVKAEATEAAAEKTASPAVPTNTPAVAMGVSAASYVADKPQADHETAGEAVHAGKTGSAAPLRAVSSYTVAKGDNPVSIARKLHVPYDDLVKLNKIDDPRKLQIGQKLQVPPPAKKTN